jgi:phospholipid/cholesterol/gamma-HCH transport system substrate-binding protein
MKKTDGNRIRLGIFVSAGLVLLIAGIYFIGEKKKLFATTFQISAVFNDINGLQVGNNVRFSGINVGVIENIEQISDSAVRVEMTLDEHSRKFLKKDVKAIIGSDGLMGNKIMVIIPGTTGKIPLADNDVIASTPAISVDDILIKIKVTSDNAAELTGDLSAIIANIRQGKGTIGKLFMDTTFAETVDEALVNIKKGAGGFKDNMNAAKHNFLLKGYFKKEEKKGEK